MKRLIIARHGNTFSAGETPPRIGARTDLPLVEEERGRAVGKYLKDKNLLPDRVYAAPLKRTMQTAALAVEEMNLDRPIIPAKDFLEIDYGPDENKTEDEVMMRLGKTAAPAGATDEEILAEGKKIIDLWNEKAEVPNGWNVNPESICNAWKDFAASIGDGETVLLVSSNGVIRFAPCLTEDYDAFCRDNDIKVATGGVCILEENGGKWTATEWNVKAFKLYR